MSDHTTKLTKEQMQAAFGEKNTKRHNLTVELTDDEWEEVKELASYIQERLRGEWILQKGERITVSRIVEQFLCDLSKSHRSGGSDERDLADKWFWRSIYNF